MLALRYRRKWDHPAGIQYGARELPQRPAGLALLEHSSLEKPAAAIGVFPRHPVAVMDAAGADFFLPLLSCQRHRDIQGDILNK